MLKLRFQDFQLSKDNIKTAGSRPRPAPYSFKTRQKSKQKSAPLSLPACGGYSALRNRRAGGEDSLRSVLRLFRPSVAPLRRRHRGFYGNRKSVYQIQQRRCRQQLCCELRAPPLSANQAQRRRADCFLGKVRQVKRLGARHDGEARFYVLSLLTFYRRVKKVSRLPAGTGEVEVKLSRFSTLQRQHQDRGVAPPPGALLF